MYPHTRPSTAQLLPGVSHRFFPPRERHLGRGGQRHSAAQQSHFPGHQLLLRESQPGFRVSQPVWAQWWQATGSSAVGTPARGWGCGWPFAGGGQRVFGGGLVASPVPDGSPERLRPHLRQHSVGWQPLRGMQGGVRTPAQGFGAHSPPPHPQLVLYCYLHGSATSSLSISYVTNSTTKHLVRERMGDLGSSWVRERVDFKVTESFKVGWRHAGASWACLQGKGHRGHRVTPSVHPWARE